MFRVSHRTDSARSRGLLPAAGDLGICEERKAPGQQKRPGRPKRYATGDVAWVMHSEVDAGHSHPEVRSRPSSSEWRLDARFFEDAGTQQWPLSNRGMWRPPSGRWERTSPKPRRAV